MPALRPLAQLNFLPVWKRRLRVWGFQVGGDSLDRLAYLLLHRYAWMGEDEKKFLEASVRPGMHVLDVGANIGLYTLLLSRLVGETGTVVALEPDPELFARLQANCRLNAVRNVELHNVAAGSDTRRMFLARSLVNAGDNRLAPSDATLTRRVEVQVTPADDIILDRPIDFIKMDVQGWESRVLSGMPRALRDNPGVRIWFEYWPYGLRKAGCDPTGLLRQLTNLGLQICEVARGTPLPISDLGNWRGPGGRKFTNLFAVRPPG